MYEKNYHLGVFLEEKSQQKRRKEEENTQICNKVEKWIRKLAILTGVLKLSGSNGIFQFLCAKIKEIAFADFTMDPKF